MRKEAPRNFLIFGMLIAFFIMLFIVLSRLEQGSYTSAIIDSSVTSESENINLTVQKKYQKSFRFLAFTYIPSFYLELENGTVITVTRDDFDGIEEGESYMFELITTNTSETVLKPQILQE